MLIIKSFLNGERSGLIEKTSINELPYRIAMLEYLGFIDDNDVKKQFFKINEKLFKALAQILNGSERSVKGNIYVIDPRSV